METEMEMVEMETEKEMKQLEHRPPAAVPKREKLYMRAFREMKKITADHEVVYIQVSDGKVSHFKSKSTFMM